MCIHMYMYMYMCMSAAPGDAPAESMLHCSQWSGHLLRCRRCRPPLFHRHQESP
jgi:hypothetical protein